MLHLQFDRFMSLIFDMDCLLCNLSFNSILLEYQQQSLIRMLVLFQFLQILSQSFQYSLMFIPRSQVLEYAPRNVFQSPSCHLEDDLFYFPYKTLYMLREEKIISTKFKANMYVQQEVTFLIYFYGKYENEHH